MASATDESAKTAKGGATGKAAGRPKRVAAARTQPERGTGGAGAPQPPPPQTPPDNASPPDGIARDIELVIADAVALGYSVVGDNVAHGRSVATRLSQGSYRLNQAADDVTSAGQRLLRLAGDLGKVWIDLIGAVARDPDLHAALRREQPQGGPGAEVGQMAAKAWVFSTDAHNNRKVSVHPLSLDMSSNPRNLVSPTLDQQGGAGGAAITDIDWVVSDISRHVTAIIRVPANQPPGYYVGKVRTVPGGKVVGTLSLDVKA